MHTTAKTTTRKPGSPWAVADAAEFLTVSTRLIWKLIDAGELKSFKLGGRRLIPDAEVQRLATKGC